MLINQMKMRSGIHYLNTDILNYHYLNTVGDLVRISKYKSTFTKGYEANFTEELFKITKVL